MTTSVYWIRHKDHTDIFSEGYVGVSNDVVNRWIDHKSEIKTGKHINPHFVNAVNKYGWDELIKEVILISTKEYCLEIEEKLRPEKKIGWNIAKGGGMPIPMFGIDNPMANPIHRAKISGENHFMFGKKHTEETKKKIGANHRFKQPGYTPEQHQSKRPEVREKISLAQKGKPREHQRAENSGRFKGAIIATHKVTGKVLILKGTTEIKAEGFSAGNISMCLDGTRKSHKGYTFVRELKS